MGGAQIRGLWTGALALVALLAVGCGSGRYPVGGKVTYPDGTPVTEGTVVFESKDGGKPVTARGAIGTDGSYTLGTLKPGDGVPAGWYKVLVAPKTDPNAVDRPSKPPAVDPRYSEFSTSGLECEVKPGVNDYPITVTSGARRGP
jgi:hypothetical protein